MAGSNFCAKCLAIVSAGPHEQRGWGYDSHADKEEFHRGVSEGCYICSWMWRAHEKRKSKEHYATGPLRSTTYTWSTTEPVERGELRLSIIGDANHRACYSSREFSLFSSAIAGIELVLFANIYHRKLINDRSLFRNPQYEAESID